MTLKSIVNLVTKFTKLYGVSIIWEEQETVLNSRGQPISKGTAVQKTARVLLLKEKFSVLQPIETVIGLSQDYARYLLTLPNIGIGKDLIITDEHNRKWKTGIADWFDIAGKPVCYQLALTEVK